MSPRPSTDYIVVHCSKTKPDQLDDKKRVFDARSLDRKHRLQGKLGLGYHYVIGRDGSVVTGRGPEDPGAHARGFNDCSVGICLIGGVLAEPMAEGVLRSYGEAQLAALRELIGTLKERFPDAQLVGHRDLPGHERNESCPGFNVAEWYNTQQ